jgi:hypothetical protein
MERSLTSLAGRIVGQERGGLADGQVMRRKVASGGTGGWHFRAGKMLMNVEECIAMK